MNNEDSGSDPTRGAMGDVSRSRLIQKILRAQIYDLAVETPLDAMPLVSEKTNCKVLLKREDLQDVFSFKVTPTWAGHILHTHV